MGAAPASSLGTGGAAEKDSPVPGMASQAGEAAIQSISTERKPSGIALVALIPSMNHNLLFHLHNPPAVPGWEEQAEDTSL